MRLARLLSTLASCATALWDLVCTRGFCGALLLLRETSLNRWLSACGHCAPVRLDGAGLGAPTAAPRGHVPWRRPTPPS